MTARRATTTAVSAVVAVSLLLILLVTWAASIGPSDVFEGTRPASTGFSATPSQSPTGSDTSEADPFADKVKEPGRPGDPAPILNAILLVLAVALGAVLLYVLYRGVRGVTEALLARRRPHEEPVEVGFDVLEAADRVADEIGRDAEAQRVSLLGGTPRNAIVEAWHHFEERAEAVGFARAPWETSSEFTLRVLELVTTDSAPVQAFAGLYREARHSDHALTEEQRRMALAALDGIHAGLQARAGSRS